MSVLSTEKGDQMRVKVHVEGIRGSSTIEEGEEAQVLFNGVLEVDGTLIDEVTTIEVVFSGGEFTTVKPHLIPGSFEVVTHTGKTWKELLDALQEKRKIHTGTGQVLADPNG
jgi:hypothetical protein